MKLLVSSKMRAVLQGVVISLLLTTALRPAVSRAGEGVAPLADAGLPRYAAADPVVLDGTASYDPDDSGPLSYQWRQVGGPAVGVADGDTATPTISGFLQTDAIQECEFELVVSDGELTSLPDRVKVIVVRDLGAGRLEQENPPFEPNKPTVIYFGGCWAGTGGGPWSRSDWAEKANILSFPSYPDPRNDLSLQHRLGDMIIVYLSKVAPNYNQPIQTIGWSCGGRTSINAAIHLNLTYADARYAVNRVTFLDVGGGYTAQDYTRLTEQFMDSSVDGEQAWVDNYEPEEMVVEWCELHSLSVAASHSHRGFMNWYKNSLTLDDMNQFNNGVIAGAYWSVLGPGKNLQLAPAPGATYTFQWHGGETSGHMNFFNESQYPGRLPEPVTLAAWIDVSDASQDLEGVVLTCHKSENAVGYELLFGSDPRRVMDYRVISDTPLPPTDVIREFPFEQTWWTIRVRDRYGTTIYADPIPLDLTGLDLPMVQNARTGIRYGLIGHAILDAEPGDTILLEPAVYEENIEFTMPVTVSSLDPTDPVVVASTIVRGRDTRPTVTFSQSQCTECTLAGLTVQSNTVAISCRDAVPTIQNCVVESPDGIALEYWHGQTPSLIDCTILGQTKVPGLIAYWKLDETEGMIAHNSVGDNHGAVLGLPLWRPDTGRVDGALEFNGMTFVAADFVLSPATPFSVFAWVKGGAPGQVIISQQQGANWLMADIAEGNLRTELKTDQVVRHQPPPPPLTSDVMVTDDDWHRVGFTWDGSARCLYVDDVLVAEDTQTGLADCSGGLNIGCGKNTATGTFFTGLIDDIRIYNRAVFGL